jgi:hypothetical protein|tara:strand:- start:1443 stop:1706 length:264 start_codon:yes stop_codon:yes gene_type:complete
MSKKDNSQQNVPEAPKNTIQFGDGPEYAVDEMPSEAKVLFARWQEKKQALTMVDNNRDDLMIILAQYEVRMKTILEADNKEETNVVS